MTEGPRWFVLRVLRGHNPVSYRHEIEGCGMELFLPTSHRIVRRGGRSEEVEYSLMLNYLMVRTHEERLRDWLTAWYAKHPGEISAVRRISANGEMDSLLTIPDDQMDSFRRVVQCYDQTIPFIDPSSELLERGDEVRVLEGPFQGLEGVLISQQGKDGGRIILRLSNILAVPTLEVKPEWIEVLRFAPAGRHLYLKMDSFEKKVAEAMKYVERGQEVPAELRRVAEVFCRRYQHLELPTRHMQARFANLMNLANTVLKR